MALDPGPALRRGQHAAEDLMTLTLVPHVPAGLGEVDGYDVQLYDPRVPHPGKIHGSSLTAQDAATTFVTIGEVELPVLKAGLHIPIGAPVPTPGMVRGRGWEYLVSAVGRYNDPALLGRWFLVVAVPMKSFATARRLDVVEVPAPEGV